MGMSATEGLGPASAPVVVDRPGEGRLVVEEAGSVAELVYELEGDRLLLVHTGVPEPMGGKGVGGALVRAAVRKAADEGLVVVPWCPFARRWLLHNPESAEGIRIDWASEPVP